MNQSSAEIISFKGGDGSSISEAVEIVGVQNFISGIQAEFEFINAIIKDIEFEATEGKIISFTNFTIHHVKVVTRTGEIKNIFFNASGFQAKIENESVETIKEFTVVN